MRNWHIVTCEYPPQIGGVSDYSFLLAKSLEEAQQPVNVWAPGADGTSSKEENIHRVLGSFDSISLAAANRLLDQESKPRTLLVQWVPHGYGRRSMNVGVCRWLRRRVREQGDSLQLMIHEPFLEFRGIRQSAAAAVHRWMVFTLLHSAERVWLSIPAWESRLRPYAPAGLRMDWLPIPSPIPRTATQESARLVRTKFGNPRSLVGHLGTYSSALCDQLERPLIELLRKFPELHILLLGCGSDRFGTELVSRYAECSARITAAGTLPAADLSSHLAACDLLIQPYADGASSRRSSLMAALSHGVPVLTTFGQLSESLWKDSGAVAIVPAGDHHALTNSACRLIESPEERSTLAAAGLYLYEERFDWSRIVRALTRTSASAECASAADPAHQPR